MLPNSSTVSGSAHSHPEAAIREGEFAFTSADFRRIAEILHAECGIALGANKVNLVYSRLAKRLRAIGLRSFRDYCRLIESEDGAEERAAMIAAMTTNVTRFFREQHHFDFLKHKVLPRLTATLRAGGRARIWSAGCSSGEEPYSIAMTVLQAIPEAADLDIKILATDLDPNMIAHGREGVYPESLAESVPKELLRTCLVREKQGSDKVFRIADKVRSLVRFNILNLLAPWPMKGVFDVIFCRNVMIYFDDETQAKLCKRFGEVLVPGGILCIGHSERLEEPGLPFDLCGQTTYVKRGATQR